MIATDVRGLAVLADGAHTAFAAGAVAALAAAGARWSVAAGAGLGAHVAALAVVGEAEEAARRWHRQGEAGAPVFQSRLAVGRERLGDEPGLLLLADAWRLGGWLAEEGRDAFLAPERADLPGRLRHAGTALLVAIEDLGAGRRQWVWAEELDADGAWQLLRAAASYPAGWGATGGGSGVALRWGGVGACAGLEAPWRTRPASWDVVCGFPMPAVTRPGLGTALLDAVQRRGEVVAAATVATWLESAGSPARVVAPAAGSYLAWAARDGADLGVEYPLPNERNGELLASLVEYGRHAAGRSDAEQG